MASRLLLLADTHVPKRARDLPTEVWRADRPAARTEALVAAFGQTNGPHLGRLGRHLAAHAEQPHRTRVVEGEGAARGRLLSHQASVATRSQHVRPDT